MTLRELRYLVALADLGHFGHAAEACHVSQPTLSTQIRKLEESLGVALFERTNKTLHVTPAGKQIVAKARWVLSEADSIVALARRRTAPLTGPLDLGVIPTLGPYLLSWLLPPTAAGIPAGDNQNSLTAGPRGPLLVQDWQLFEKHAHFNRERIPERVVHAKGSGAYGTLRITGDVSRYTRAKALQPGAESECFLRFSTVAGERGAADAERDVRGFALKVYTEEGNWDLVGNNTPVFFVRDPYKFPDFIRSQKRDPRTNLRNPTAMWDFWSLSPESLHQVTILMSDRGAPKGCGRVTAEAPSPSSPGPATHPARAAAPPRPPC